MLSACSEPGTTGTPTDFANKRARILSPKRVRTGAGGPTNTRPAAKHAWINVGSRVHGMKGTLASVLRFDPTSAKEAFSLRKPYPGCTQSHPWDFAKDTICSTSKYASRGELPVEVISTAVVVDEVCSEAASAL